MQRFFLEFKEHLHLYLRDGKPLFGGTPDRVLRFPKEATTVVLDYKFGRNEVPPADVNMQLRAYLTMIPEAETDFPLPYDYSEDFRPSSLLRFQKCPGALSLQRRMASHGLVEADSSEDAAEGQRLHKAICERMAPRDDLTPEQLETVEKAERMEAEFLEFVLGSDPILPFYGAIVQPRVSGKADPVFYTNDDFALAKMEINAIWDAANQEGAPRNPSVDACRYCPCKAICPEYQSWVTAVEKIAHLPASTWSPEQWDVFLSRRTELQRFLEERYKDAKAILSHNPDAIPGWELRPGNQVRQVSDIPQGWLALSGLLNAEQFSECCNLSLSDVEEVLWRTRRGTPGQITQKESKAIVNSKLGALITLKQNAPSLKKKETEP